MRGGLACTQRPPVLPTSPWVSRTWVRLSYLFPSLPLCGVAANWLRVLTEGHSSIKQPSSQVLFLQVQEITPSPNPTGVGWEWRLPWEPITFFPHMLQIVPSYTLFKLLSLRVSSLFCWSPELYNYNYYPDISCDKHLDVFPQVPLFMTLCMGNRFSIILDMHLYLLFPTYNYLWEWSLLNKIFCIPKDDFPGYILFCCITCIYFRIQEQVCDLFFNSSNLVAPYFFSVCISQLHSTR